MKRVKIVLHKNVILDYVDALTFKRVDATLDANSDRSQNALSADSEDTSDLFLLSDYCDRRDAVIRKKLKFCLVDSVPANAEMVYENNVDLENKDYVYELNVNDDFTSNDLASTGKMLDDYIKRGAIYSWYTGAGIKPNDDLFDIEDSLDNLAIILRGRPWGRVPMQPFGPAFYDYLAKR